MTMETFVKAAAHHTLRSNRLSDGLYQALKSEIATGVLSPGQRLVEADLARRYQLSQAPVREALRRLAHEGLVLHLPRRGTFVSTISVDEARRSYALRAVLEEFAAREFCRHAHADATADLAEILEQMETAAADDDLQGVIDLDIRFHQGVWDATGHPLLPRIWPMIEASLRGLTTISNRVYWGNLVDVAKTHRPLLDSLSARDESVAAHRFHNHVTDVWRRVEAGTPPSVDADS
jgi:DNA-binding GntR family transcriptional regulator